jgi:NitT/TauT family transport system permease protein
MGSNRLRIFIRMRLPAAASTMFAGFGLAITFATIGAVVGELVAGTQGLGYMANEGAGNLDTTLTFAAVVILSVLGIVLFYLVRAIEYMVVWWNRGR